MTYHRLTITATDLGEAVWLLDERWFLVQGATGTLDTSVLAGSYYVAFGPAGLDGVAHPIELEGDTRLTQRNLEGGPNRPRQAPALRDERGNAV